MKFREIDVRLLTQDYADPAVHALRMSLHAVCEAVNLRISKKRPQSDFWKLLGYLGDKDQDPIAKLDVCEVHAVLKPVDHPVRMVRRIVAMAAPCLGDEAETTVLAELVDIEAAGGGLEYEVPNTKKKYRRLGLELSTWLLGNENRFWAEVRVQRERELKRIEVFSSDLVTYFDQDFPVAKASVKGERYVLQDARGEELESVLLGEEKEL